jgi:hypothetical protein
MQSSRAGDGGARGRRQDAKQRANTYQPLAMPLDAVTIEVLDGKELQLQAGAEVAMLLGVVAVEVVVGKVMQGPAGVATALAAGDGVERRQQRLGVAAPVPGSGGCGVGREEDARVQLLGVFVVCSVCV